MARESMDLLELLHNRRMDGDVNFLREALAVLVTGIMGAVEWTTLLGQRRG